MSALEDTLVTPAGDNTTVQMEQGSSSSPRLPDGGDGGDRVYDPDELFETEEEYQARIAKELKAKPDNSMKIVFSIWSTMMGSTVLVMPKLFRSASLGPAIVSTIIIGLLTTYTAVMITKLGKIFGNSTKEIIDKGLRGDGIFKALRYFTFVLTQLMFVGACMLYHDYLVASFLDFIRKDMSDAAPRAITSVGAATVVFCIAMLKSLKPLVIASSYCIAIIAFCLVFVIVKSGRTLNKGCALHKEETVGMGWSGFGAVASLMSVLCVSFFCHNFVLNMLKESTRPMKNARNVSFAFLGTGVSYLIPSGLAVIAFRHCDEFDDDFIEMFHDVYSDITRGAVILLVLVVYPIIESVGRSQFFAEVYGENMPFPYRWHLLYNFCFLAMSMTPTCVGASLTVISSLEGIMGTYWILGLPVFIYMRWRMGENTATLAFKVGHGAILLLAVVLMVFTFLAVIGVVSTS
eukprot:CAMPEP_0174833340 /NCGR_PEP_ID=MMETSP1114-20130205/4177_1 /TAXON_ID=312471 /ORGANISM="Neobodo designis, Strain CCAP 1951/1" /LENGTH=461 /DNA_ID=CAMNT_0016067219 /DNA_START=64 /DNA_END=1449 /DNA_ORIENTATION=-